MIVGARTLLAKHWKTKKLPNKEEWVEKVVSLAELDRITKINK